MLNNPEMSLIIQTDDQTNMIRMTTDVTSANGIILLMQRTNTGTTNHVLGAYVFSGKDADGTALEYGRLTHKITDPTVGSTDSQFIFNMRVNGTLTDVLKVDGKELVYSPNMGLGFNVGTGFTYIFNIYPSASNGTQVNLAHFISGASGNTGGNIRYEQISASPAVGDDIFQHLYYGRDSGGNEHEYFRDFVQLTVATNGSEEAERVFRASKGGALTDILTLNPVTTVVNEGGVDIDFRIESLTYDAFFIDAGNEATHIMNNASGKVSFFGVTAVTRQTELTDELTSITHTAPGTPDYAVQDLTNVTPFGFVTKDEGNTVLSVIANLQARVNELETKMTAYGLLQDAD